LELLSAETAGTAHFLPRINEEYARQIARDWNVKASGAGFVTKLTASEGRRGMNPQVLSSPDLSAVNNCILRFKYSSTRALSPFPTMPESFTAGSDDAVRRKG
jgi:hypothetical protein